MVRDSDKLRIDRSLIGVHRCLPQTVNNFLRKVMDKIGAKFFNDPRFEIFFRSNGSSLRLAPLV